MNIVIFSHPEFIAHQSMPRYAKILAEGMKARGHTVHLWFPHAYFSKLISKRKLSKWLGYIDQYIIFTMQVKRRLKKTHPDTLYVFTDHALGPWVPYVKELPHVIHCHDFLAQRSVLGEIAENKLGWTGKQYQLFIKKGYVQGKYFISISEKTRQDLHRFLQSKPAKSEMIYNGLNQEFSQINATDARKWLSETTGLALTQGYFIHVGGNQFYKNRIGVIEIYDQWRKLSDKIYPLLLIGESPDLLLFNRHFSSPFKDHIHFFSNKNDQFVKVAYAGALAMLYPSLAEGFGWPIAEAMASGCPVITTNEAPMSEVAGTAGFLIPLKPVNEKHVSDWATRAGLLLEEILNFSPEKRKHVIEQGIENSKRFDPDIMLDHVENIYKEIVKEAE